MHPLAVGPAPHILAGFDDRAASLAELSRGVRLVVAPVRGVLVLVTYGLPVPRGAQIFVHSLFNFETTEIWRSCHVCLLRVSVSELLTASLTPAAAGAHLVRRQSRNERGQGNGGSGSDGSGMAA